MFQPLLSTIEDTYVANVLSEKNVPEQFRIYDTAGLVGMISVFTPTTYCNIALQVGRQVHKLLWVGLVPPTPTQNSLSTNTDPAYPYLLPK